MGFFLFRSCLQIFDLMRVGRGEIHVGVGVNIGNAKLQRADLKALRLLSQIVRTTDKLWPSER